MNTKVMMILTKAVKVYKLDVQRGHETFEYFLDLTLKYFEDSSGHNFHHILLVNLFKQDKLFVDYL